MNRIFMLLLLLFGLAAAAPAQMPDRLDEAALKEADAVARKALETFRRLVDRQNFEELGFTSADEPRAATLGSPIEEFMIRLDALREYIPDQRGVPIDPVRRLTYPVLVGDDLRSSLTVGRGEEGWAAVSFGAPNYTRLLGAARDRLSKADGRPASDYFEVRVPALNVSFVGREDAGSLVLTPILDDPRFGLEGGSTLSFEQVLEALAPAAREHNGLPT